jgi:hypothetical protein
MAKYLYVGLGIITVLLLIGCGLNYHGLKYSISKRNTCSKSILTLNIEDSHICCENQAYKDSFLCIAAFDKVSRVLSSYWSYLIPLIPFLITTFGELTIHKMNTGNVQSILSKSFKRFCLYSFIFLARVFALYLLPLKLEDFYYKSFPIKESPCWFRPFVSKKK